ncbi:type III-A CRISPR-associated RAMP protein Csm4 [Clostridium botulinum]|uniref:type III-A CRISPR-associated RAMP protein Csm4 n=1 Tax=Clostridium botulinum TaxID=1491 RepID=UPI00331084FB|nr:type III-A CRISPR-associated RAMP protein Csm4 [Clostridium botulinum]HDK7215896.1 type III-A CRISPR-associated RAMP protein Csm4 [Clostridium botulinum]
MKKVILKIDNETKFHIGNGQEILEYIPSDKLYSAIINSLALTYSKYELNKLIEIINEKLQISSAFMGIKIKNKNKGIEKSIDFLPRPYMYIGNNNIISTQLLNRKKFKKINYVSNNVFLDFNKHYDFKKNFINYDFQQGYIIGEKYYVTDREINFLSEDEKKYLEKYKPIINESVQRNYINRFSKESIGTYYDNFKVIVQEKYKDMQLIPYFYFYIKGDLEIDKIMYAILEGGIGGKRSLGAGTIKDISIEECDDFKENGERFINISMIYPDKQELNYIESYALENRNGYIYSQGPTDLKKPWIRMIKEGGVFTKRIKGNINDINVKDIDYPIYTYGKAFFITLGGNLDEL